MPTVHKSIPEATDVNISVRHTEALLTTGALQSAIFNSANFSSIATDAKGVIQIFNVGAEHPLGADVEDLDDALRVGRDARKVSAVEDRALQGSRRQQRLRVSDAYVDISRFRNAFMDSRHMFLVPPDPDTLL